ncbi:MAG TPA: hypothetical protein VIU12_12800 [Chryseolinea sp.]
MKKKGILSLLGALFLYGATQACAICGCGAGNYYLGIMPQYSKNFVGVRYRTYSFTSHIGEGYNPYEATHETFRSTEIWMRFYVTPRLQIISLVNYNFNSQLDHGVTKDLQGLGDIPILANYNLINTNNRPHSDERVLNHNLFAGGGVKLPVGKYQFQDDPTEVANANFQLGTGSVDFLLTTLYTLRYKRLGLSVDATYKMNTKNSNDYRFGNRINGTTSVFYVQQIKSLGLMPNAGVYFEDSGKNQEYGLPIDITGGRAYFASAGVETYYKKLSVGFNYQSPFSQFLADGHSKAHDKMMVHVTFLF